MTCMLPHFLQFLRTTNAEKPELFPKKILHTFGKGKQTE